MGKYPLQQVYSIKKDRVTKAEKVVREKKELMQIEEDKLRKVKEKRDEVKSLLQQKINQLNTSFDEGTTSDKILQMKGYIEVVKTKLKDAEQQVVTQQKQLEKAEAALAQAIKDLKARRIEEEKIKMHKELWEKEDAKQQEQEEAKQQDELGQSVYEIKRKTKKE